MSKIELTEIVGKVLVDINDECLCEAELGYDDWQTLSRLQKRVERRLAKTAEAMSSSDTSSARQQLVQVCALTIKALQAFDRHYPLMRKDTEPSRQLSNGPLNAPLTTIQHAVKQMARGDVPIEQTDKSEPHSCEDCAHVPPKSASWPRPYCIVTGDYITRDGMACDKWKRS